MTSAVIAQLKTKSDAEHHINGLTYNLGPESSYLGTTRCSNNNNFEEEYILGTDNITYEQNENIEGKGLTEIEEIEFRSDSIKKGYYKIRKEKYSIEDPSSGFDVKNLMLDFTENNGMIYEDGVITQVSGNFFITVLNQTMLDALADIQEQTLSYQVSEDDSVVVSRKVVISYYVSVSEKEAKNITMEFIQGAL